MSRIETEVVIIGGGIAGCSAALHLARQNVPVTLLDKGFAGAGASGVNFGGVRRNGRHIEEMALATRSLVDYWHKLGDWLGTDCEFTVTGHLKFARNADELVLLDAYAQAAAPYDLGLEPLSRNALMERYDWTGEWAFAAWHSPSDGQANPRLVGPAFAKAARAAGADLREQETVVHAETLGDGFEIATESGLTVRANRLLNCAGGWGAEIAALFGERVPIVPLAPQMAVTEPCPYFLEPVLGVVGGNLYARQIPRGNVILGNGGGGEVDLASGRTKVRPADTLANLADAVKLVRPLADVNVIRTWTGIEGKTPDGYPVIGPSATTSGLFHAIGFSGHGFQLGPATGAVLAELAMDDATPTDISAMSVKRFTAPAD